jgi:hypothetical protein
MRLRTVRLTVGNVPSSIALTWSHPERTRPRSRCRSRAAQSLGCGGRAVVLALWRRQESAEIPAPGNGYEQARETGAANFPRQYVAPVTSRTSCLVARRSCSRSGPWLP